MKHQWRQTIRVIGHRRMMCVRCGAVRDYFEQKKIAYYPVIEGKEKLPFSVCSGEPKEA